MPPLICLAEIAGEMYVYNGLHRSAMFALTGDNPDCLIDCIFGADNAAVFKEFEAVNRAVSVPAVYFENIPGVVSPTTKEKKDVTLSRSAKKQFEEK